MDNNEQGGSEQSGKPAINRRQLFKRSGLITGAAMVAGSGFGRAFAAGGDSGRTLKIGSIGWDEDVALSALTKVVLEDHLGYQDVKITKHGADDLFQSVADGSLDSFMDVWLPKTHEQYWAQYGDKVERLGPWYLGAATLGLTVPDYVQARSIADLPAFSSTFGSKIVGIEPSAGEMQIVKDKVIPGYNLSGYELTSSSTPDMLDKLGEAIHHSQPIVVTLYKPNWAFQVYRLRYLADPKGLISGFQDHLYSIVRKNLQQDHPDARAFIDAIRLSPQQLGQLELAINAANSPEDGVDNWLNAGSPFGSHDRSANRQAIQPWIDAARRARS